MEILKKILTCLVLPAIIVALVWFIVESIMVPVNFDKQRDYRTSVAVERLKDIRTLQTAYKTVNGKFTASADTLIDFYENGKMEIIMKIGSHDDSVAVANTERLKKRNRKITPEQMLELYRKGENLVFSVKSEVAVKDTLFNNRPDFCVDSLRYIPFSGGVPVEMNAVVKQVSGVNVPLFEAKMHYNALLKGLDRQLVINIKAMREDQDLYPGLMVGSVTAPNNNAGNWE